MFKTHRQVFLPMLPVGALVGFFVAAVVNGLTPKIYESEAVIEVKARTWDQTANCLNGRSMIDTVCFPMEFDKILSRHSLEQVVRRLDLKSRWKVDEEAALLILKRIVTRDDLEGTDLISVRVRHANRFDARDIAMEVVRNYMEWREEIAKRDAAETQRKWQDAIKEQEGKVEERRRVLVASERTLKKNLAVDGTETLLHLPDSRDQIDAKRDSETDVELLQTIKFKLIRGESIAQHSEGVVIDKYPVIADTPISPNVSLNLMFGTALGLLVSLVIRFPNRHRTGHET